MVRLPRLSLPLVLSGSIIASSVFADEPLAERTVSSDAGSMTLLEAARSAGVPEKPLREAFDYFDRNRGRIENRNYLTIIDYSLSNKEERMFVIDLENGDVERRLVSHGAGRDDRSNPRDVPIYFSNTPDSREGSVGFFITGTEYASPKFERALNLLGQEKTNDNAFDRRIVFHGADYVDEDERTVGRSWGCPAVDKRHAFRLIDELKDGSLFYIVAGEIR